MNRKYKSWHSLIWISYISIAPNTCYMRAFWNPKNIYWMCFLNSDGLDKFTSSHQLTFYSIIDQWAFKHFKGISERPAVFKQDCSSWSLGKLNYHLNGVTRIRVKRSVFCLNDIGIFLLQQSGGFFTCVQVRCVCFYIHTTITLWTMESDVLIWGIKAVPPVTVLKRRKSGSSNYTSPGFVVIRAVYMSAVKREYHKKYQPKRKSHSQLLCQSTDILRS